MLDTEHILLIPVLIFAIRCAIGWRAFGRATGAAVFAQLLILCVADTVAWLVVVAFAAAAALTAAMCAPRHWCGGTDGDAWMPSFFLAIPAFFATAYLLIRLFWRRYGPQSQPAR